MGTAPFLTSEAWSLEVVRCDRLSKIRRLDVQMPKASSTPTEESVVKPSARARPRSATRGPPRLDPTQREAIITREAVAFFAECGFEGQTRQLAKRLRITQPLLYRYFPTKEALIERVYQEVFVGRWKAS